MRDACDSPHTIRHTMPRYIVIEYCENGDLSQIIDRHLQQKKFISEKFIWQVLRQIASSLMACHNRQERILHRDLKPANILLTSNYSVKVCDFGLSTLTTTSSLAYSKVGTPLYMSPEQMHGLGYTDKSDIWSLGCIAYVKHFSHCIFVISRAGTRWLPSPRRSTLRTTLSCSAW